MKKMIVAVSCLTAFSCASQKVTEVRNPAQATSGLAVCKVVNNVTGENLATVNGMISGGAIALNGTTASVTFDFKLENSKSLTLSAFNKTTRYSASTSTLNTSSIMLQLGKDGRFDRTVDCVLMGM